MYFVLQRGALEAEAGCGSFCSRQYAPGLAQDVDDVIALAVAEGALDVGRMLFEFVAQFGQGRPEALAFGEDDGALDEIFEFANVSWPAPVDHDFDGLIGDEGDAFVHALGALLDEIADEEWNVFAAFAERRQVNGKNVEAVVKIAAEFLVLDGADEIAIAGGEDAGVDADSSGSTEALELLILEHAQQLGLELEGNFSNFIKEKSATVGEFEASHFLGDGAGEGSLFMAEKFALEEAGGNGGAVELYEGTVAARTHHVNGAGDALFAGSGLAGDKDGGVGVGDDGGVVEHTFESTAVADDVLEAVAANFIF